MSAPCTRFYEFGAFCVDAESRLLLRDGEVVPLTPKVFDTLLLLVQHHGQVLEKGQMIETLWPDSFVEEGNLTYNISALRKALGETRVHFAPFDFTTGDQALRRAIELNPNLAVAHQLLAASLLQQSRRSESIAAWQKARELDPLSGKVARLLAYSHLLKQDYASAQEIFQQAQELGPPFIIWGEVEFYLQDGNLAEALATLRKLRANGIDDPLVITSEGIVYAAQGKRGQALRVINELQQLPGVGLSRAAWIARIYAMIDEKQPALDWLERGLQGGAIAHFFKDAPVWDTVRGEPRFHELLQRMGIPQ